MAVWMFCRERSKWLHVKKKKKKEPAANNASKKGWLWHMSGRTDGRTKKAASGEPHVTQKGTTPGHGVTTTPRGDPLSQESTINNSTWHGRYRFVQQAKSTIAPQHQTAAKSLFSRLQHTKQ